MIIFNNNYQTVFQYAESIMKYEIHRNETYFHEVLF
jgi:hypothetical protein